MTGLTIHLKIPVYEQYEHGKDWELWPHGEKFNEYMIKTGTNIRVCKGNTKEFFDGTVGQVVTGTLDDVLGQVDYHHFAPSICSIDNLKLLLNHWGLGGYNKYIAFEVKR